MQPYYERDGLVLYHGDCRDVLPQLAPVDLVLTDPPYGVGCDYGAYQDTRENLRLLLATLFPFLLTQAPRVVLTLGNGNQQFYPPGYRQVAWVYRVGGQLYWQPMLVWGDKGPEGLVVEFTPEEFGHAVVHPCPKPLDFWTALLVMASEEGQTVLDPFAGAGTTLVAAQATGRKAIGIEQEERYCEHIVHRLGST